MFLQVGKCRDKTCTIIFQLPSHILRWISCKRSQLQSLCHLKISPLQWNHRRLVFQETIRNIMKKFQCGNKSNVYKGLRSELGYKPFYINSLSNSTSVKVILGKSGDNKMIHSKQNHTWLNPALLASSSLLSTIIIFKNIWYGRQKIKHATRWTELQNPWRPNHSRPYWSRDWRPFLSPTGLCTSHCSSP